MAKGFDIGLNSKGHSLGAKPGIYEDTRDDLTGYDEEKGISWEGLTVNVYEAFRSAMLGKSIIVEAVPGGRWCGLELYYNDKLKYPDLQVPEDFRYLRPLLPSNKADSDLVLKCACAAAEMEANTEADKKRWFGFIESLTSAQNDPKTKLAALAAGKANTEPYKKRTMDGRNGAHLVVPKHDWFPESVRAIDPKQLLSILPDAEADLFMLNLGRAVVGVSGGDTIEGVIEHDYRYYAGVVGDASIGKSDLIKRIMAGMESLGFVTSIWNTRKDNPFGYAPMLMSDATYHLDEPTKTTHLVVNHPILKQWASGDAVKDNTKGGADVTIRKPTSGGFTFCANGLNVPELVMSDDAGVSDRFLPLACYELAELRDMYGLEPGYDDEGDKSALRGMTGFMWAHLAEQAGVGTEILAAWLMRKSADLFIYKAGYVDDQGALVKRNRNFIKSWVAHRRQQLRFNFTLNTKKDVVDSIKHSIAYYIAEQRRPEKFLNMLPDVEFNYNLLATVVGYSIEPGSHKVSEPLKKLRMQQLAPVTSGEFFRANARQLKAIAEVKGNPLDAFRFVSQMLRTKGDGFGYPSNPVAYSSLWRSALKEIPILVKAYQEMDLEDDNSALAGLCVSIGSIFLGIDKSQNG